jgi:hypothetical protein
LPKPVAVTPPAIVQGEPACRAALTVEVDEPNYGLALSDHMLS